VAEPRDHALTAPTLGAIAGFVDTAGFLALFGLFTAHVTGNLVVAGARLAREHTDQFAVRVAMIPIFMVTVAMTVLAVRRLRARGRHPLVPLLGLQIVLLLAFMALGVALRDRLESESWAVFVVGGVGVVAMAIQNAVMRIVVGGSPTTMMTGNVTQFAIDLVDTLAPADGPAPQREARKRLARTGAILLGFVLGAALGAALVHWIGFWCMATPALALVAVIFFERTRTT
jgi:uncharacterized membrane protein YoaK (UPF0700 family)